MSNTRKKRHPSTSVGHRGAKGRKTARIRNWNERLSESASETVFGIVSSIDGGTHPAFAYLRSEYLSKYCDEGLTPASERRDAAIKKFLECEKQNAETTANLAAIDPGFNILPRVTWERFVLFARGLIKEVLGPLHDEVVLGSFSGGASTSRRRTESHPAQKFTGKVDITESAWSYVDTVWRLAPLLKQDQSSFTSFREVEGSVLFTVPKKTDIDRCACKEPDFNMFLQKGVGAHIRRRLRRFGIDLNDQSRNRRLAELGSRDGSLATLDLSSASDLISHGCVRTLLPTEWYLYLDDIRSHTVRIGEETHRMEMFSSMGNGFTFELESLIFFSLMRAISYFEGTPGVVSVYGDDIIIPSGNYDLARFVLTKFGFRVNEKKSFAVGPFRESCGGHYHGGEDITPFYLKRKATNLTDLIRVANQLRRWALQVPSRQYEIPGLFLTWRKLADFVPKSLWGGCDYSLDTRLVTPPGEGWATLQRVAEPTPLEPLGEYLHWHSNNWNRTREAEPSSKAASTNQICRRVRAKPGAPVCVDFFWEEVVSR